MPLSENETLIHWVDLPRHWQYFIIKEFQSRCGGLIGQYERIFTVANPLVVCGPDYWRIEPENGQVLKIALSNYL